MARSLPRLVLRLGLALAVAVALALATLAATAPDRASAHRSGCHRAHSCPSDHATYRWRGLRCVKPTSDVRDSSFRRKVRYDGRTYYCKR